MTMVGDGRFAGALGPAHNNDVETRGLIEQAVFFQVVKGQVGQASLFCVVDGGCWPGRMTTPAASNSIRALCVSSLDLGT